MPPAADATLTAKAGVIPHAPTVSARALGKRAAQAETRAGLTRDVFSSSSSPRSPSHFPIIQLLGDSGPLNFRTPYVFAAKYVAWAEAFGFDGYLLDAEFKGDDGAFAAFLDVFADALHAANRSLHVFLYPDMGKAAYVNASRADEFLGTWAGHCSTIPDFLWGLNQCVGRGECARSSERGARCQRREAARQARGASAGDSA
jgi:hypothetical protein